MKKRVEKINLDYEVVKKTMVPVFHIKISINLRNLFNILMQYKS